MEENILGSGRFEVKKKVSRLDLYEACQKKDVLGTYVSGSQYHIYLEWNLHIL